jgi:hypothetical protein
MRDQILKILTERKYVTFQELRDEIVGFDGPQCFKSGEHPALEFTPSISIQALTILQELLHDRTIYLHCHYSLVRPASWPLSHLPGRQCFDRWVVTKEKESPEMFASKEPPQFGSDKTSALGPEV